MAQGVGAPGGAGTALGVPPSGSTALKCALHYIQLGVCFALSKLYFVLTLMMEAQKWGWGINSHLVQSYKKK